MSEQYHDYRGYAGRVASGVFRTGDKVTVLPSGFSSTIEAIDVFEGTIPEAFAPQSVTLRLADDIDISRGDTIVKADGTPKVSQDIELMICWLNEKPMQLNGKYTLRHTAADVKCMVKELLYKVNISTLENQIGATTLGLNEIGRIKLRTTKPLVYDSYQSNRVTGSLILVDEATNETVGAAMIEA
jgi:sulfate adenylyltransferase subunit 1